MYTNYVNFEKKNTSTFYIWASRHKPLLAGSKHTQEMLFQSASTNQLRPSAVKIIGWMYELRNMQLTRGDVRMVNMGARTKILVEKMSISAAIASKWES